LPDSFTLGFIFFRSVEFIILICCFQVSLKFLGGTNTESAFIAANLPAALVLIETWERKLNPPSPEASEIIRLVKKYLFIFLLM
jgi:hypothetical protein